MHVPPPTVFTVAGLGTDYDGDYYDSGEEEQSENSIIYTNGTRFANCDNSWDCWYPMKFWANLGDVQPIGYFSGNVVITADQVGAGTIGIGTIAAP